MAAPIQNPAKCEVRSVIRFLHGKCHTPADIDKEIVSVYGNIMNRQNVTKWCHHFCEVFGIPEKRLLCTWHVDRSWRRSILRLITKKEIQVEAYKIVRSLLVETDEAAFDMLKEVLKNFDEKEEIVELKRYFKQTYSKRSEVWTYIVTESGSQATC
ncbi:uncharacterized protein TNCV_3859461 [Trichonephila clavipes]|nr:uncharacterized protein TNCV_3859461 [Trichonephila clavipes]